MRNPRRRRFFELELKSLIAQAEVFEFAETEFEKAKFDEPESPESAEGFEPAR